MCVRACACVGVCVCVFSIQIHSSRPIWTKVSMKHPWGQGQGKVRLVLKPDHQEACTRPWNLQNRNQPTCYVLNNSGFHHRFFGSHLTDFNQNWCVDRYTMQKYYCKKISIWFDICSYESDISVFAIGDHSSRPIWTKIGVRGLWHVGKAISRLLCSRTSRRHVPDPGNRKTGIRLYVIY